MFGSDSVEGIKAVIWGSCLLAVAISLLDGLCPGKTFNRQIKLLFSVFFLVGVAVPILKWDFSLSAPALGAVYQEETLEGLNSAVQESAIQLTERNLKRSLVQICEEEGVEVGLVEVKANIIEGGGIEITSVYVEASHPEQQAIADSCVKNVAGVENAYISGVKEGMS